jgi:hypothetical protein
MNVTAVQPTRSTFVTVYPDGTTQPETSALNVRASQTVANLVVVPVGDDGAVRFFNAAGSTHLVVDVIGWYAPGAGGAGYVALDPPRRDLDTRTGTGLRNRALGPGAVHRLRVARYDGVPAEAAAVMLGVVAVAPTSGGYLTVYPGTAAAPTSSNLNFVAGATTPNAVVSGIGSDGTVAFRNAAGSTHVVSDLFGYFLDPADQPTPLTVPPPAPPSVPGRPDLADWHPPAGSVPATGTVLYVQGDVGDPFTGGTTTVHTLANADIVAYRSQNALTMEIEKGAAPAWHLRATQPPTGLSNPTPALGEFTTADGAQLQLLPSPYTTDCSPASARFIVDEFTLADPSQPFSSTAASFTVRFEYKCVNTDTTFRGFARWDLDDPTVPPPPPPASTFAWQPPPGSTPAAGSYLYLSKSPGVVLHKPPTSTFQVLDSAVSHFGFRIADYWWIAFGGPRPHTSLPAGFYEHTELNPALGTLYFEGPLGHECYERDTSVAVDGYTFSGGEPQSVTLRFVYYCDGSPVAHYGKLHWEHP